PTSWCSATRGTARDTSGSPRGPSSSGSSTRTMPWAWTATDIGSMRSAAVLDVIRAYDDPVVRAYCWGRFWILRQRFLDEIGQYLPARGRVLDLGCGFGLFSLYYARWRPGLAIEGLDLNPRRIAMARAAARRLGLDNVHYAVGDVMDFRGGRTFDAAYMLDIVHHIPEDTVRPLLDQVAKCLPAGARLVIKDVDRFPA